MCCNFRSKTGIFIELSFHKIALIMLKYRRLKQLLQNLSDGRWDNRIRGNLR